MNCPRHILSEEGILASFSIAKKIDNRLIKKLQAKAKKDGVSDDELNQKISELVIEQTKLAIENHEIPGLVWDITQEKVINRIRDGRVEPDANDKKTMELTYLATLLSKKISEKQLSKYDNCYIINAIINLLGLSEDDFEDFYQKFSDEEDSDSESDNEGDKPPWEDEDDEGDGYDGKE